MNSRDKTGQRPTRHRHGLAALLGFILVTGAAPAEAATCNVPTATYPTIQSAVNVINCSEIVLSAGSFFEFVTIGRNLELQGAGSQSTTIFGKVIVSGFANNVRLEGLKIFALAGTFPLGGLVAWDGTVVIPDDLLIGIINPLFADGFESGDRSKWSSEVP